MVQHDLFSSYYFLREAYEKYRRLVVADAEYFVDCYKTEAQLYKLLRRRVEEWREAVDEAKKRYREEDVKDSFKRLGLWEDGRTPIAYSEF